MSVRIPVGNEFAIVDDEDAALVSKYKWHPNNRKSNTTYARGPEGKPMHRMILDAPKGLQVDHINGNGLDNRRANLRLCTPSQNAANSGPKTGRYKGVSLTRHGTYRAVIHIDGKQRSLGNHATEVEAAHAYDAAAREVFGEFAKLNAPESAL